MYFLFITFFVNSLLTQKRCNSEKSPVNIQKFEKVEKT